MRITVAVDVMSGDAGCAASIAACRHIRRDCPDVSVILVGRAAEINEILNGEAGFEVEDAADVVAMSEPPARAIRRRETSMRRALELVANGRAHAAVSAGNTGALLGLGAIVLRMIDGISRPAIASFVPNRNVTDSCCMLDLGANVECTPEMLRDFALMGTALAQSVKNIPRPTVGLLNVGEEDFKGAALHQRATALLEDNENLNFVGNVEGYDMYRGGVDVIVCDGFTGNVALKVSEGLATMLGNMLRGAFQENLLARLCGVLAFPVLRKFKQRTDHRAYNGACLLGLRGVVVKSHGNADEKAFAAAVRYAVTAARQDLPSIISRIAIVADARVVENNKAE